MIRLYFSGLVDEPFILDNGPGTYRYTASLVWIEAVGKALTDPISYPKAWIQFDGCVLTQGEDFEYRIVRPAKSPVCV